MISAPLNTVRVVEFEGIGPGPLAGRLLADMGAAVTVIARPVPSPGSEFNDLLRRGKKIIVLDLKTADGLVQALDLVANADILIEGNRPGVMERLGLGPADCALRNPRLVYGRMTGWGQTGPLAQAAGHDLNFVALTGLLSLSRRGEEAPVAPPTMVGDASGALGLCMGVVSAVLDVRAGGPGRVVDAAIVDMVAALSPIVQAARAGGHVDQDGPCLFNGSPFYETYACADGGHITIGSIEPQFYALLLGKLGLDDVSLAAQYDSRQWSALKARFAALFATQPREHWRNLLEGTDACFAPVLTLDEAVDHPHNKARAIYEQTASGMIDPAAAPRFAPLLTRV